MALVWFKNAILILWWNHVVILEDHMIVTLS